MCKTLLVARSRAFMARLFDHPKHQIHVLGGPQIDTDVCRSIPATPRAHVVNRTDPARVLKWTRRVLVGTGELPCTKLQVDGCDLLGPLIGDLAVAQVDHRRQFALLFSGHVTLLLRPEYRPRRYFTNRAIPPTTTY